MRLSLLPECSWVTGQQQQNGEEKDTPELEIPGDKGEALADFLLILPPIDRTVNQGTVSDNELQILQ